MHSLINAYDKEYDDTIFIPVSDPFLTSEKSERERKREAVFGDVK